MFPCERLRSSKRLSEDGTHCLSGCRVLAPCEVADSARAGDTLETGNLSKDIQIVRFQLELCVPIAVNTKAAFRIDVAGKKSQEEGRFALDPTSYSVLLGQKKIE